jgi:hypothetical protein
MSTSVARCSLALLVLLAGCGSTQWQPGTMDYPTVILSADERANGWRPLFDGVSLAGWRVYHGSGPAGWRVANGMIERVGSGGDLVTDGTFANFELAIDWKVAPGGNSGIIYRIDDAGEQTYMTGPEMQVLDDERHADGKSPLTSAGAVYGLYPAARGVARPAGEWNEARLVVNGNRVEHWLNGTPVAKYDLGSADWEQRVAASKFNEWKGYGRSARGRIGLQDHGDQVFYRNIRIRELP